MKFILPISVILALSSAAPIQTQLDNENSTSTSISVAGTTIATTIIINPTEAATPAATVTNSASTTSLKWITRTRPYPTILPRDEEEKGTKKEEAAEDNVEALGSKPSFGKSGYPWCVRKDDKCGGSKPQWSFLCFQFNLPSLEGDRGQDLTWRFYKCPGAW